MIQGLHGSLFDIQINQYSVFVIPNRYIAALGTLRYSGTVITIHCPPITIHPIFHSQLLNLDSRFRGKDGEGKMLKLPANRHGA